MTDRDREQLKNRLRVLIQAPQGIGLDTPEHWAIDGINEPRRFFEHLSLLMEAQSVLYFEGTTIHPEVASFYANHATAHPISVACDTVFPIPDIYHVDFSSAVVDGMVQLASQRPIRALFNHVKGYRCARLIFAFHDAFEDCLRVSGHIPEPSVAVFCRALGVSYARERTEHRSSDSLRHLLYAMEHPEKVKIHGVPWWQHLVNEFMSGFRDK